MTVGPSDHVLIVGGGFSGTLLAINILRHDGPSVTLVERSRRQTGRGVAYAAADPGHLLNVRAGNMSALPDDPGHLVRWLEEHGGGDGKTFVPRIRYGDYLREMLEAASAAARGRLAIVEDSVTAIERRQDGRLWRASLDDGPTIDADVVVLAVGNLPPHAPAGIDLAQLSADVYAADPWSGDIAQGLSDSDEVVLLGTGLTAIDAALLLDSRGFRGRILALSRRGLEPRRHLATAPAHKGLSEKPQGGLAALVRSVRSRAEAIGWRDAVDELRPVTQMLWGAADDRTRARFLRHLRPFWDVHRHRLAPQVAERIDTLKAEGRLVFAAGKVRSVEQQGDGAILRWRPRHGDALSTTQARRLVNCTGPQGDLLRSDEALLRQLLANGTIRADSLRLGIDVDAQSRVLTTDGRAQDDLYCVGPMTRGASWEIVAVPDLRRQSWDLARRLAHAQWIGGEGL